MGRMIREIGEMYINGNRKKIIASKYLNDFYIQV